MTKFSIEVCRTSYSFRSIEVEAESKEQAEQLALSEASNHSFDNEKHADYSLAEWGNKMSEVKLNKEQTELQSFLEYKGFKVFVSDECCELENYTKRGVSMLHVIQPFSKIELISTFSSFDVDEEIDLHRQDERYRKVFTIRQSVYDFEEYERKLEDCITELNEGI